MSAADTGHLVLSTLHTTNAAQSVNRILDFFRRMSANRSAANSRAHCKAVICQRMITTVDGHDDSGAGNHGQHAHGEKADRGKPARQIAAAIETGNDDGMINFNQALFQLVKAGKVSRRKRSIKRAILRRWR